MSRKVSKVFQQSGVIPYRVKNGNIEVLLITSRNSQNWGIPKGGVTDGMSPAASAVKEAWEEAGVVGQVDAYKLNTYEYRKKGKTYKVKMFLLPVETVLEDYPEVGQRQRQWVNVIQAVRQVKKGSVKRILKEFGLPSMQTYVDEVYKQL
ncbi:NUDIX hydrolase [Scytonema hofmannii PCC 7110]|uniref:NUDIX hydrolase n=1 Tax=Scytonema hofmannii PCC 7110 TaxID=128403 RepID=A0A139XA07_9CYAN|nr:NUDIX hydrolase [Scytonema hofmannii]KYC41519.1 NUDIX hydrolase [Scytonema hofmannii PCC 7110]